MTAGFEVEPDDLEAFTANLQSLVEGLGESASVLGGVHLDPLVFGVVGRSFGSAVRDRVAEAKECLGRYEASVGAAKATTRLTADSYRTADRISADTFKRS